MLKKICEEFSGIRCTVISGLFLVMSLILMLMKVKWPLDPAWITVILSGYPLLYLAVTRLVFQKWISSCLLISIAMLASLMINELFAAGEVAFIMAVGAILEDMTVDRAKKGLAQLINLNPAQARVIKEDGSIQMVDASLITSGTKIRVLPGETIAADGMILSGVTSVDQSIMTGESLPVDKTVDDEVYCGTINCYGSIDIVATENADNSTLKKMIRLVEQAEKKKAPMQRIADQWSVWLVPVALMIAIGAFAGNLILGSEMIVALNRGVTVLVVFCPCALALATPTTIMAAIGQATKHGVIIKSGEALEILGKSKTFAFDKTGTLSYGTLKVSDFLCFTDQLSEEECMSIMASSEMKSEHPLAKALISYVNGKQISFAEPEQFSMEAGKGVCGIVQGKQIYCGNEAYLKEKNCRITEKVMAGLKNVREQGKALILMSVDNECVCAAACSDVLKPEAAASVEQLKEMNVNPVLLTGDHPLAAQYFADQAGITEIRSELLPEEKVEAVQRMKQEGHYVCMIGDGVNDAPALKVADVGVAMGGIGSDIAIEAADVVLMRDDLKLLVYLKRLSAAAVRTIRFNITVSMCINAIAVTCSVLGILNPVTGALVHNAGSALVVLNAALLYDRKYD